jgi:hypothetical protein
MIAALMAPASFYYSAATTRGVNPTIFAAMDWVISDLGDKSRGKSLTKFCESVLTCPPSA